MTGLPDASTLEQARLALDLDGPVATVTLSCPERRNSQVPSTWQTLAEIGANLPEETRVVVVRGAGASFSAGLDVGLLSPGGVPGEESVMGLMHGNGADVLDAIDGYQRGFTWLRDPRFVSIAQVQGHAIGAGFQLALACDLRVVSEDVKFCMKEPALGLVPDLTGTKPLVDLVGYSRALEICATARYVLADEARELGLATAVVPVEELEAATTDLIQAILANPTGAVRETKALLQGAAGADLDEQRLREREAQLRRFRELVA
jgi:enoyl-CoA hydratase/carnithine racemase